MSILITSNEPKPIRRLFSDAIELPMRYDFRLYTRSGIVGIERKKVPGDLLSSIDDGRLRNEIFAMREECDIQVILLHGVIKYNRDGTVYVGKRRKSRWTEKGIRNIMRTLEYVEGCYIESARNNQELVDRIYEIQEYLDKKNHLSMRGRPGIQTDWIIPTKADKVIYFYQGLNPRVGIIGAKKLYDRFPNPLDLFQATIEDIDLIHGFGKKQATNIHNFLRGAN